MNTPAVQREFTLQLPSKSDFWQLYFDDGQQRGVFLPHQLDTEVGHNAILHTVFQEDNASFTLATTVIWRRLKGRSQGMYAPGSALAFQTTEAAKVERLVAFADGKDIEFIPRASPRIPIALRVRYRAESAFLSDFSKDISIDGLFLHTTQALAVGTPLAIKLHIPGKFFAVKLKGQVVRNTPDGVGIQFQFATPKARASFAKLVRTIAQRRRPHPPQ